MSHETSFRYQEESAKFAKDNIKNNLEYLHLGLAGEVGEVCELRKKYIRDGNEQSKYRQKLKLELGDILWYISQIATANNLDLGDIARTNLNKLADRKTRNKIEGSGDNR